MKQATRQKLPPGWTEKKVRELIAYYDNQTEEEGAAEIAAAEEATGQIWMSVPSDLVPAIRALIARRHTNTKKRGPERRNTRTHQTAKQKNKK